MCLISVQLRIWTTDHRLLQILTVFSCCVMYCLMFLWWGIHLVNWFWHCDITRCGNCSTFPSFYSCKTKGRLYLIWDYIPVLFTCKSVFEALWSLFYFSFMHFFLNQHLIVGKFNFKKQHFEQIKESCWKRVNIERVNIVSSKIILI